MQHKTEITVRGYECDFYSHVNNSVYLNYLEHARSEFLKEAGFDLFKIRDQLGVMLVVVRNEIDYRSSSQKNDVLEIESSIQKIGSRSCTFKQVISNKSSKKLAIEALVTWVVVDVKTQKSISLPENFKEILQKYKNQ